MSRRKVVTAALGVLVTATTTGCPAREYWHSTRLGLAVPPAARAELDHKREAALASSDPTVVGDYLRYLWQFDWEYRHYIARLEAGKPAKLPDDLVGFEREQYVQEAIAAWAKLRPRELPADSRRGPIVRTDFYATALGWGCRDSERAFGKYLLYFAEAPEGGLPAGEDFALLATECGNVGESTYVNACRAGADLLTRVEEPSYADLDLDKRSPEPSVRIRYLSQCRQVLGNDKWMTDDEKALLSNYAQIADSWFQDHHPQEYAAWVEEQRKAAERAAALAAEREAQAWSDDGGWGSSSSSDRGSGSSWGSSSGASSSGASSSPSAPAVVSVRIRNTCPQTVKLFFGDKPRFGSGRSSSISSNSSISQQMREGDMLWIVDDRGEGISSYTASPHRTSIEISSSCTGFR